MTMLPIWSRLHMARCHLVRRSDLVACKLVEHRDRRRLSPFLAIGKEVAAIYLNVVFLE